MEQHLAAVIGCGRMGAFTSESVIRYAPPFWLPLSHAEAISSHPGLALAAMCDIDGEALARAADKYQVERRFNDPIELLDAVRPTLLGIATRTDRAMAGKSGVPGAPGALAERATSRPFK